MSYSANAGQAEGNATQYATGSTLDTPLMALLNCEALNPGAEPSYQICKTIYSYHPLGGKMVDSPIRMAQSQEREIAVPGAPESVVRAFKDEWHRMKADRLIANLMRTARMYGVASIACVVPGEDVTQQLDPAKVATTDAHFSVFDPLNTSGSLVLDQNPESPDYQRVITIAVAGKQYNRSRVCVVMNEDPIYIQWTSSAFGYVGRSVYQRALFALKSFVQTMITDDMISAKLGLLIVNAKAPGSIINRAMDRIGGFKRSLLQTGQTRNVLTIDIEEKIETLNMMNVDGAGKFSRDNIIKNIATAADMPASLLNQETLAEGFGEGVEDAKNIARYIDRIREEMDPAYEYMTKIVQMRAWSPEFFETVKAEYPEVYGDMDHQQAFMEWRNSFTAEWPNLLTEPDSEKSKTEKVKFDAIIQLYTAMAPQCDPDNKASLAQWAADNLNEQKLLFPHPLELDFEALANYEPPAPEVESGGEGARDDSVMPMRNKVARVA